ncbi:penicillin-binding transpeptidase domain-containing protein [Bacteroides caecigallinarum]|uniref:penicillin-binding transpeptidase domain-containing protein n=1 Tax=Bacteroides caecigallinarum TaxID=1411144 RepID=UPI001F20FB14|nr:penicillin-binding transpeptidase domain-containing protein [Bacteroides caecigallinarum]MCF2738705.1 penicillin-binding protein [Bacteroides caecigallinarum]
MLISCQKSREKIDKISSINSTTQTETTAILESKLSELNALSGQAIIMEVQTGQIKAMVGLERKDSATYQTSENLPQTQTLGLIQPLSILAALETGKVKLSDTVNVGNGVYSNNGIEIKDHNWQRGGYGTITIQQGLAVSSEIAAYKTIEKAFGSEQAYKAQLNKMRINLDSLNTLKMLTLYNDIAKNENIANKANTDSLKQALKYVVTDGLGQSAKSEKVQVAGKTGTLQLENGSYIIEFCGYFPADNPQYSIIVSINKEDLPAAGFMAGDVFRQIVDNMNK